MTIKTIHAYHPFTRVYTGPVQLDESDMSPLEPGVGLIPGGCIDAAPPTPGAGQYVAEQAGAWVLLDIPAEPEPDPAPAEPERTPAQLVQALDDALEDYLDGVARAHGFRNMDRAVSYRGDPDVQTDQVAVALFVWRSACWVAAREKKAAILAGDAPIPTREEAIAMLPPFEAP